MYCCRAAILNLRKCFFFDRRDHNFIALRAGSIQHEERKASVARYDAKFLLWNHAEG